MELARSRSRQRRSFTDASASFKQVGIAQEPRLRTCTVNRASIFEYVEHVTNSDAGATRAAAVSGSLESVVDGEECEATAELRNGYLRGVSELNPAREGGLLHRQIRCVATPTRFDICNGRCSTDSTFLTEPQQTPHCCTSLAWIGCVAAGCSADDSGAGESTLVVSVSNQAGTLAVATAGTTAPVGMTSGPAGASVANPSATAGSPSANLARQEEPGEARVARVLRP